MSSTRHSVSFRRPTLAALILAAFALGSVSLSAGEVPIDNFDDGNIDGWAQMWGTTPDLTYDALDREGLETSGSLRVAANYFDPNITTWQQAVITIPLTPPVNAAAGYTQINVSVKVDPSSTLNGNNHYGLFEIKRPDGTAIGGATLTHTEWTNLSFAITATPNNESLASLIFQLGWGSMRGPVIYNLDNLSWTERLAPPPPPTLSLEKAEGGLNLVHTSENQYGRHNIYTLDDTILGFYNAGESVAAVSYSFTLLSYPSAAAYPGFQTHMFLVPGSPTVPDPDWTQPNVIYFDVGAGPNGSGNGTFRWKTNQAGGNSQLYVGGLPVVNSASVLGTWTVTIEYGTNVTLRAPDGASTSFVFDPEAAALFAGPIRVYIGVQGDSNANRGRRARLGGVKIVQTSIFQDELVLLEDNFPGDALDTAKWVEVSGTSGALVPGGVQLIPPAEAGWLVSWGQPDTGFILQSAANLTPPIGWNDVTVTPITAGLLRQAHISKSQLPEGNQAYFQMVKSEPAAR